MSDSLLKQYASTPLYGGNASAVEALYEQYLGNPESVPAAWRDYFKTLGASDTEVVHSVIRDELVAAARNRRRVGGKVTTGVTQAATSGEKQAAVSRLIQVYGLRGHQIADIDPLGLMSRASSSSTTWASARPIWIRCSIPAGSPAWTTSA